MPAGGSSSPSAEALLSILSIAYRGAGGETATVRLSDGSSFVAPAEVVVREGLSTGMELDPARLSLLHDQSDLALARSSALRLLSRAPHTRRGLALKLTRRGFGPAAVEAAIARMAELGYLDDRAFAADWTRSRLAGRAEGWKAVYRGLLARGVPRAVAGEAASEACTDEAELEAARRLAATLAPGRVAARLAARGFRSRTIARIIRELARPRSGSE